MDRQTQDKFESILMEDLVLALGCTEPIAIALAAAKSREVLGEIPDRIVLYCSGNIIKNAKSVTVPNSGGLKGINVAAALGIIGGDSSKNLNVLEDITEEDIQFANALIEAGAFTIELVEGIANLYIKSEVHKGDRCASVEIKDGHTNITEIVKDGEVLHSTEAGRESVSVDTSVLSVANILEFANVVNFDERPGLKELLENQIKYNSAISEEGLNVDYGLAIGRTIIENGNTDDIKIQVKANTAAGSDARMGGCTLPVMINSGSGNQGMTVSIPVITYANHLGVSHDKLLRALVVSNLMGIHQKQYIGKLSAFCGVVSASSASGCGIGYLLDMSEEQIGDILTNTLVTSGGIVCDGAKASCASKIAVSLENALLSIDLAKKHKSFAAGDGIVGEDIEHTIQNVGRMGKEGMKSTDIEILNIMIGR